MVTENTDSAGGLAIEWRPIDAVTPYAGNPRKNDEAVAPVAASIRRFGWRQPIVVDKDGVVIAGHTRLRAAREIGLTRVPVHVAATLTEDEVRAYRLADNKTSELAEWDDAALALEIELLDDAIDLTDFGFEFEEDEGPRPDAAALDDEEVPEAPAVPITRRGDVVALGDHRLVCGDSRDAATWSRLLGDERADCYWTDPPYGVAYVGKTKDALTIENDALDETKLAEFLREVFGLMLTHSRGGAPWYVAAPAGPLYHAFDGELRAIGVFRQGLVWVKDAFVLGRSDYHYRHEPIFYGWTPGAAHSWHGDRTKDSILEVPRPRANREHPTMKPVKLVSMCLENSSKVGDIVVDPFGGSGTTLLACEGLGRRARLVEFDPKYCDVIIARWEALTGRTAVRPERED